ncbi:MAG: hypothetical protein GC136_08280 [Alphaproteobacteria bacterium]|nr:hypothetical protein [Alphaproteobacteria bacterium]
MKPLDALAQFRQVNGLSKEALTQYDLHKESQRSSVNAIKEIVAGMNSVFEQANTNGKYGEELKFLAAIEIKESQVKTLGYKEMPTYEIDAKVELEGVNIRWGAVDIDSDQGVRGEIKCVDGCVSIKLVIHANEDVPVRGFSDALQRFLVTKLKGDSKGFFDKQGRPKVAEDLTAKAEVFQMALERAESIVQSYEAAQQNVQPVGPSLKPV